MYRYLLYFTTAILAFSIGISTAFNFYWKTEENVEAIHQMKEAWITEITSENQTVTNQVDDTVRHPNREPIDFDDLKINSIGLGAEYTSVIRKLGKPLKTKKGEFDECGGDRRIILHYSGLVIEILGDGKGKNFTVVEIEMASSHWQIAPNIRIGSTRQEVQAKFGQADGQSGESGLVKFWYGNNDGWASFYFRDNKLVKVSWEYNFC